MKAAPRPAIAMIPEPTRTTAPPTRYRVTGSPSRLGSTRRRAWRESGCRCPEDAPDRCIEGGVELGLALLGGQATGECPGEARDHTVVPGQACVRLLEGVTAGQCDDAQHPRVLHEIAVEAVLVGQGQFEHHPLVAGEPVELRRDRGRHPVSYTHLRAHETRH